MRPVHFEFYVDQLGFSGLQGRKLVLLADLVPNKKRLHTKFWQQKKKNWKKSWFIWLSRLIWSPNKKRLSTKFGHCKKRRKKKLGIFFICSLGFLDYFGQRPTYQSRSEGGGGMFSTSLPARPCSSTNREMSLLATTCINLRTTSVSVSLSNIFELVNLSTMRSILLGVRPGMTLKIRNNIICSKEVMKVKSVSRALRKVKFFASIYITG